ncbi:MAG: HIT domain-containing protein [Patescibacteria group bacterium]
MSEPVQEVKKAPITFYEWPGGRKSVAGGTRTAIKLDRPWQSDIVVNKETCPFCTKPQKDVKQKDLANCGSWRVIENAFTPYPFHRMVIPTECWSKEELHGLGGQDKIRGALHMATEEIAANAEKTIFITLHVGALAGQNVTHLHYHVVAYKFDDNGESPVMHKLHELYDGRYDHTGPLNHLVVSSNSVLQLAAGGLRAGQFFLFPTGQNPLDVVDDWGRTVVCSEIAGFLNMLITTMNEKFRSVQGLPPDFKISLMFQEGKFRHGLYVPILNHLGSAEEMAMYEDSCQITMPWTHEATVEHLKS